MPAATTNAGAVPQAQQLSNHVTLDEVEITAAKGGSNNPYERPPDQLYGEKDPQFYMSNNNYNPEMAGYVQTQNLMASESGFMKFSIWFNGIGSPMIANFGVGERTTTEPKITPEFITPEKIAIPQSQKTENSGIGSNLKSNATPVSDGKFANFNVSSTNLNSNTATGNFGIYKIEIDGVLYKFGKADLDRVTQSSGLPTRLHQQLRELRALNPNSNVTGSVIENLGKVTTEQAKTIETKYIQDYFNETRIIPMGNFKSFKPQ
jgi:hypothetical protein